MSFERFHWLSHYGLCANMTPCSTNIRVRVISLVNSSFLYVLFFCFCFLFLSFFFWRGGGVNKTIISQALDRYETVIANAVGINAEFEITLNVTVYNLLRNQTINQSQPFTCIF